MVNCFVFSSLANLISCTTLARGRLITGGRPAGWRLYRSIRTTERARPTDRRAPAEQGEYHELARRPGRATAKKVAHLSLRARQYLSIEWRIANGEWRIARLSFRQSRLNLVGRPEGRPSSLESTTPDRMKPLGVSEPACRPTASRAGGGQIWPLAVSAGERSPLARPSDAL